MLPWRRQIRQLNYQNTDVYVVNVLSAIFGDQRSKALEKKVSGAQVSNTVFSHLNLESFLMNINAKKGRFGDILTSLSN